MFEMNGWDTLTMTWQTSSSVRAGAAPKPSLCPGEVLVPEADVYACACVYVCVCVCVCVTQGN